MRYGLLGPLQATSENGEVVGLGGHRQKAVLAILLLNSNEVVSRERLIDDVWGSEPTRHGAHTLQVFISRLRKALVPAGGRLETHSPGYMLVIEDEADVDAALCESLYDQGRDLARAEDYHGAMTLLSRAEALWRGPALVEFAYEPFAQAPIARLHQLRSACREARLEAAVAVGRHREALPELEELTRSDPLAERPWMLLMLALFRSGRNADALAAYHVARRNLVDELGLEPGSGLRDLQDRIIRQDPALGWTPPERSSASDGAPARKLVRAASFRSESRVQTTDDAAEAAADVQTAADGEADTRPRSGARTKPESRHTRLPVVSGEAVVEADGIDPASHVSAPASIRILIADDQALVRGGLRMILEAQPDLTVVAEANDGEEALELAADVELDLVLMDIEMPRLDGIAATRRLLQRAEGAPKVLVLTTFDLDRYVYEAIRAGASGFLLKTAPPRELVAGVRAVMSGDVLLAPEITRRLLDRFVERPPPLTGRPPELARLTTREVDVLSLIGDGKSNAEIAAALAWDEATVGSHAKSMLAKLGLRDRVQAVALAYRTGLMDA